MVNAGNEIGEGTWPEGVQGPATVFKEGQGERQTLTARPLGPRRPPMTQHRRIPLPPRW